MSYHVNITIEDLTIFNGIRFSIWISYTTELKDDFRNITVRATVNYRQKNNSF